MGLEGAEILMEIEEVFDIDFDDAEGPIRTVGELYDRVLKKLSGRPRPQPCLSTHVALRFRHTLSDTTGLPRKNIKLNSLMDEVIPQNGRKARWRQLSDELNWQLPKLKPPFPVDGVWALLCIFLTFMLLLQSKAVDNPNVFLVLFLPLLAVVLASTWWIVDRFSFVFPKELRTVRDVVIAIQRMNTAKNPTDGTKPAMDDKMVWETLCQIIAVQLEVPREKITPEARFVEDLGVG